MLNKNDKVRLTVAVSVELNDGYTPSSDRVSDSFTIGGMTAGGLTKITGNDSFGGVIWGMVNDSLAKIANTDPVVEEPASESKEAL